MGGAATCPQHANMGPICARGATLYVAPPLQGATCQCLGFNAQEVKLGVWDVFDVILLYITK